MESLTLAGQTLLPGGAFAASTILVQDGRIAAVHAGADSHADIVAGGWIVPGLIDLQVNGAFGFDLTADSSAIASIASHLPATGVTGFLGTLISSPLESYSRMLHDLDQAAAEARGARVLGVHLEGPYLSPRRKGAHNPVYLRTPSLDEIDRWVASPSVRLVTVAPELPGALEFIRHLRTRYLAVSAGHSDATYEQAAAGFDAGVTWGTHLFNAMSPLAHREPGLAGALLSCGVPYGLIADGIHVHPAAVKLAWRAEGPKGLTLVTDAMAAMGMTPGQYRLGDREVTFDTRSARLADGTLAGSILQMDQAVRNLITFTGCSLAEAITAASATPARIIGLASQGQVAPGFSADLVLLDPSIHVQMTLVAGQVVYSR
ncbi:MAG: N-acetylglucosamine-6-phosphate deacetylase [Chloroflexi bacterium]|nr:N-acetylglucosamine-6-phosphate deacetylase [Chloroflexota bacterium]